MPSHPDWDAFDGLLRELGALRTAAGMTDPVRVDAEVRDAVDVLIRQAAEAVDRVADVPPEDQRVVTAWEYILVARDYIEALGGTAERSRQLVVNSIALRKRALEAMASAAAIGKPKKSASPPAR